MRIVQILMLKTNAYYIFDLLNDLIKPLSANTQALLSTLFISVVPIFFIYALNLIFMATPWIKESVLYYLISFAIGGLLGDVFYHTLPHMNHNHESNSHEHDSHIHELD